MMTVVLVGPERMSSAMQFTSPVKPRLQSIADAFADLLENTHGRETLLQSSS